MTPEETASQKRDELVKLGYRELSEEEQAVLAQLAESKKAPPPEPEVVPTPVVAPAAEVEPTPQAKFLGVLLADAERRVRVEGNTIMVPAEDVSSFKSLQHLLGVTPAHDVPPAAASMKFAPDGKVLFLDDKGEIAFFFQG